MPAVAAITGFSTTAPTPGIARQSSGRSLISAPEEKARSPSPVMTATRSSPASKRRQAACKSIATCLLIAFSFSGRRMVISATRPAHLVPNDLTRAHRASLRRLSNAGAVTRCAGWRQDIVGKHHAKE